MWASELEALISRVIPSKWNPWQAMKPQYQLWLRTVWTVARWEFLRYFKLRDQVLGLVSLLVGAGVGYGAMRIADSAGKVELAVIGASPSFAFPPDGHLTLADGTFTTEQWRQRVEERQVDGLLVISTGDDRTWRATLTVRKEPTWLEELRGVLQAEKVGFEMQASALAPDLLATILAPAEINIDALAEQEISKSDRLVAFGILGAMLITTWIGLAYMLTGITGEKQQRVTEQIVSAIRPQSWIDGKLVGITAAAIGSLAFLFVTSLISLAIGRLLGLSLSLPDSLQRWEWFPVLFAFYLGGVLFWNCFYAAVASIIYDPNTSSRTSLLFLPVLPMVAAGLVISQPDGTMMRTLALLPGTSSTAMPMRVVLGEVAYWEVGLSVGLMVCGIALLRRLAGRILAAGIMLYGKEPTWLDIAKTTFRRQRDVSAG